MFQDLGSSPATMEAAKACDAIGCVKGYNTQKADARQAYIQAKLRGAPTWVMLPEDQWEDDWYNIEYPVVPLLRALYGHPDSGTYWEEHCDKHCQSVGFDPIPNWPSCYYHGKLSLFLVIYVDDFKMSGPEKHLPEGWKLIMEGLNIDPPTEQGQYLGCMHEKGRIKLPDGSWANSLTYNSESFLRSCIQRYVDLVTEVTGRPPTIQKRDTPFLPEDHRCSPAGGLPAPEGTPCVFCPWCRTKFAVEGSQDDPTPSLSKRR